MRTPLILTLSAVGILAAAGQAAAATNLAMFNFQLKTAQEDWVWLEKFMSDQMATDLVQDRSLSVVARDRMQLIAQQMKWIPEFATTDAKVMGGIRSQLQIEYLVTGVCAVNGDQLEITAQIVEVGSRKEVHRKTVTGKTDQVIDLQKQLSADAMAWFTKRPVGEILKTLPMWTRSIPAVRALYEGMHLYDQGRYAEGWVKFRDASREDKNYVEAIYWVGKMYYFMYRYDHARRELERFVYLNCLHPRMGDALVEYANTFETDGTLPQDLLALYDAFGKRFANARVVSGYVSGQSTMTGAEWAKKKRLGLMVAQGQYRQVAVMEAPLTNNRGDDKKPVGVGSLLTDHAITGEIPPDNVIMPSDKPQAGRSLPRFGQGRSSREYRLAETQMICGYDTASKDELAIFYPGKYEYTIYLLAESGSVFKSLRFTADTVGDEAQLTVSLMHIGSDTAIASRTASVEMARRDGLSFDQSPGSGMLVAQCSFSAVDDKSDTVGIRKVSVDAVVEKVPQCGAVRLKCSDNDCFHADIDGAFGRFGPGIIGPLAPGRRTLTLRPVDRCSPYGEWSTGVDVRPGQVTQVTARLPWKDADARSSIVTACLGTDHAEPCAFNTKPMQAPAVQVDQQAIRLIWSQAGDLWSSVSTDGNTFTTPVKLPLPVSSAWCEDEPRLLRDESGRFILTFCSNRDSQHRGLIYACWSRDFANWSAPALVHDSSCSQYDLLQDSRGRLICAMTFSEGAEDRIMFYSLPNGKRTYMKHIVGDPGDLRLFMSLDGYNWVQLGDKSSALKVPYGRDARLLARDDGLIEAYYVENAEDNPERVCGMNAERRGRGMAVYARLKQFVYDGRTWSEGVPVADYRYDDVPHHLSAARCGRGAVVLSTAGAVGSNGDRVALAYGDGGTWQSTGAVGAMIKGPASIAYHPSWGYVLSHGSFVMRSSRLPALLRRFAQAMPAPRIVQQKMLPYTRFLSYGSEGLRDMVNVWNVRYEGFDEPDANASEPAPQTQPGILRWVAAPGQDDTGLVRIEGPGALAKARAGSGTVHPDALVASFRSGAKAISVAIDSTKRNSAHYDVLRIDPTGKEDFHKAAIVPWYHMCYAPHYRNDPDQWKKLMYGHSRAADPNAEAYDRSKLPMLMETCFEARSVKVGPPGNQAPAHISGVYSEGTPPSLTLSMRIAAEGLCRFGKSVFKVRVCDDNNNLRLGDVVSRASGEEHDKVLVFLDDGSMVASSLGGPLPLKGELYVVNISTDDMTISARPYTGPTCRLRIDHVAWRAHFEGDGFSFDIAGGREPVALPPGKYELSHYREYSLAGADKARYMLSIDKGSARLQLPADRIANLLIGSPLVGKLTARVEAGAVHFHYVERTALGAPADIWLPGGAKFPNYGRVLAVAGADGKPVFKSGMEWDWGKGDWVADWQPREGVSGTFTATVEADAGPFIPKPATATFTVK